MSEHTTTVGPVCLDEYLTVLAQYDPTLRWNGWLGSPRFDAWTVEFVLALIEGDGPDADTSHEWIEGGLLRLVADIGDGPMAEILHPDADGLYALGAYGWVWAQDSQPWTAEHDGRPNPGLLADYVALVDAIGDGFHPDTRGDEYGWLPDGITPAYVNWLVSDAVDSDEFDAYEVAVERWQARRAAEQADR